MVTYPSNPVVATWYLSDFIFLTSFHIDINTRSSQLSLTAPHDCIN
jgi:hypothetical protein